MQDAAWPSSSRSQIYSQQWPRSATALSRPGYENKTFSSSSLHDRCSPRSPPAWASTTDKSTTLLSAGPFCVVNKPAPELLADEEDEEDDDEDDEEGEAGEEEDEGDDDDDEDDDEAEEEVDIGFALAWLLPAVTIFCVTRIFSSTEFSMTNLVTWTSRSWPIRCTLPMAWASRAGFKHGSSRKTWFACVRLMPTAPALILSKKMVVGGSLWNSS